MAAIHMHEAVEVFNARHPDARLPTRFGLHTGTASFKLAQRQTFDAPRIAGLVVIIACRLQTLNKELYTSILASEEPSQGVSGIATRAKGAHQLKGISTPVAVMEILGLASSA